MPQESVLAKWNVSGRHYVSQLNALIADDCEGRKTSRAWPNDPRTREQARAVLESVAAEERHGRWHAQQPIADRAHEPFVGMLDDVCQNLRCVCILGMDEFLVCPGTTYKPGPALHMQGGKVTERPDILAVATTRSHDLLLVATPQGFSVSRHLDGEPMIQSPWPEGVVPGALDILQISEDGQTIAFVEPDMAVWLGHAIGGAVAWRCIYPGAALLDDQGDEDESEDRWSDSMMHCALSPDGRFIAYGSQCNGHVVDHIDDMGMIRRWAEIGQRSEYPHYACFSDDSAYAAFNSCHFHQGATLGVRLADVEGAQTPAWEEDERTREIDGRLRVHAATWLPLGDEQCGFALAGAGYLDIVSSEGRVRSYTHFGSSASSIDYCPKTGVLAVASCSGFLHLYDPTRSATARETIGYRPIHEHYRWVLWRDRAPFRW